MKKLTPSFKCWHEIHIRDIHRRRIGGHNIKNQRKNKNKFALENERTQPRNRQTKYLPPINCPEDFSLETNFAGVVMVLLKIRRRSQRKRKEGTYIDFRKIRTLSPAAALVLAAEIDRWNRLLDEKDRIVSVDVEEWDPQVQCLFADMGFFDLLRAGSPSHPNRGRENVEYVKFRTGTKVDGEIIERMRIENLDPIVNEIPKRQYLYTAVTEAMINVVHHAYGKYGESRWWLSASHDRKKNEITIMIYDQGNGIPKTLPRNFSEQFRKIPGFFNAIDDHAKMIEIAHDLDRSSSKMTHRGHGLERDVRGYLEKLNCHGCYRVISLKGEYVFEKDPGSLGVPKKKTHFYPLRGTLIEWRLSLT